MKILITANKGGVGCSSIAYLIGALFPLGAMYSNDPWHIPDDNIKTIYQTSDFHALQLDEDEQSIFDISMARNHHLAHAVAQVADLVFIPSRNDLQSIEAAMEVYRAFEDKCNKRVIVINGFRSKGIRKECLSYLLSHNLPPEHIIALRDSRLMDRMFCFGPHWESSIQSGKGMHRLNRTMEIFSSILINAIK